MLPSCEWLIVRLRVSATPDQMVSNFSVTKMDFFFGIWPFLVQNICKTPILHQTNTYSLVDTVLDYQIKSGKTLIIQLKNERREVCLSNVERWLFGLRPLFQPRWKSFSSYLSSYTAPAICKMTFRSKVGRWMRWGVLFSRTKSFGISLQLFTFLFFRFQYVGNFLVCLLWCTTPIRQLIFSDSLKIEFKSCNYYRCSC